MLEGYLTKTSFLFNEEINIYINVSEETKINLEIIYYLDKNIIKNDIINVHPQKTPELCYAEGCNWNIATKIIITKKNQHGLYLIKLTNNNEFFYIPFVIKNTENPNKMVVILNTNTWCAYNIYGNGNFYGYFLKKNTEYNKITPYNKVGVYASSFNKPQKEISNSIYQLFNNNMIKREHLFYGEHFLWDWLIKNKYDFDFITDIDVEDEKNLLNRKIIFLNCHPEYWNHKMYFNLLNIIKNHKTNLIYLGGNGIWRKIIINHKLNRIEKIGFPYSSVLNDYKNSSTEDTFAKKNPISIQPYTLLGMYYDDRGANTSYELFKCTNNNSWIFEGTNINIGDLFGEVYEGSKPSGHELDKIKHIYLENENNLPILLAKGLNPDKNNNTNNLGGGDICEHKFYNSHIFSCGSITFTRCLNDPKITIILKNVINKFIDKK